MADRYGYFNRGNEGWSLRNEEFDEEDVWAVVKERKDSSPTVRKSARDSSSVSTPRRAPTPARIIPRFHTATEGRVQQSVPVNIPDWSKIYRNKSSERHSLRDGSWAAYGDGDGFHGHDGVAIDDDDDVNAQDDDDDDDDDKIPPHEWIAKKLARTQMSSFSVCEGAGRTLKGRDLSKVRNAVLTKTGFLE